MRDSAPLFGGKIRLEHFTEHSVLDSSAKWCFSFGRVGFHQMQRILGPFIFAYIKCAHTYSGHIYVIIYFQYVYSNSGHISAKFSPTSKVSHSAPQFLTIIKVESRILGSNNVPEAIGAESNLFANSRLNKCDKWYSGQLSAICRLQRWVP